MIEPVTWNETVSIFLKEHWFQVLALACLWSIAYSLSYISRDLNRMWYEMLRRNNRISPDYKSELWAINKSIKELKKEE